MENVPETRRTWPGTMTLGRSEPETDGPPIEPQGQAQARSELETTSSLVTWGPDRKLARNDHESEFHTSFREQTIPEMTLPGIILHK